MEINQSGISVEQGLNNQRTSNIIKVMLLLIIKAYFIFELQIIIQTQPTLNQSELNLHQFNTKPFNHTINHNHKLKHQMSYSQFDWYRLSLINEQKPDLQKFEEIIRNGNIFKSIDRVPTSYRKKLLVLFQILSAKMKQQARSMKAVNDSLGFKRNAVADKIDSMEANLESSKNEIVRLRAAVAQKKKLSAKLKEKIQTLKKSKGQQVYFCPFCSRNDFASRELFTFHMFTEHQTYKTEQENNVKMSMPNNSFSSSAHNELKDFIITLKDKEMEMMRMILSQKKEMQTQDLQKMYEQEMNLMTMKNKSEPQYLTRQNLSQSQPGLNEEFYGNKRNPAQLGDQGNLGELEGQIQGESQFLFYQKSQKYKKAAQKQDYTLRRALEERKKDLNRHPYYDIFKDLEENKSMSIDALKPQQQRIYEKVIQNTGNKEQQGEQYGTGYEILSKFNLKSNEQLPRETNAGPVQPLRMTATNLKYEEFNPSITDRLKEEQRKNSQNNSIYSNFGKTNQVKANYSGHEYAFNAGPLLDDKGGYSDFEDYFGQQMQRKELVQHLSYNDTNKKPGQLENVSLQFTEQKNPLHSHVNHDESMIEDQQIKINPGSYSFVSKSSYSKQHISQLLSPNKDQSRLQQSNRNKYNAYHNVHQKSSQIVDLSDSFSKRDFELSKDESSINLSDLKLSKLQKKKAQQKLLLQKNKNSPTYANASRQTDDQNNLNFAKKPLDFVLLSEEKPLNLHPNPNEQKINLLDQFQRKVQTNPKPLIPSSYSFQKKQTYQFNQFYRQSPQTDCYNRSSSQSSNRQINLEGYVKREFLAKKSYEENGETVNMEKAMSPQEMFANQMRRNSSYGSFKDQSGSHMNGSENQNSMSNKDSFSKNGQSSASKERQSYVSKSLSQESQSQPSGKVDFSEYERVAYNGGLQSNAKSQEASFQRNNLSSQQSGGRSSSRDRKKLRRHEDLQNGGNDGILNEFFKKEFTSEDLGQAQNEESQNREGGQSLGSQKRSSNSYSGSSSKNKPSVQSYYRSEEESGSGALDQFIK